MGPVQHFWDRLILKLRNPEPQALAKGSPQDWMDPIAQSVSPYPSTIPTNNYPRHSSGRICTIIRDRQSRLSITYPQQHIHKKNASSPTRPILRSQLTSTS
ncbi:hypothetical protein PGTUg99_019200 [Puccinia graminis f. sp. tritici]|uniref:Uncharacterized protein n=1 Tax=Puccinia graminis f. sp. tritici TaxID=56615 RepID=A0A5B0SDV5_PUCGR|nr:hypothetical protein PGTUg99_019200 [Puccinia graminis f. sp. tritici]